MVTLLPFALLIGFWPVVNQLQLVVIMRTFADNHFLKHFKYAPKITNMMFAYWYIIPAVLKTLIWLDLNMFLDN